jgi:alkaline phosphatase D
MPAKIAFTSCSDPMDEPQQPIWDLIAAETPDHLVLLGDQIYMDFGILLIRSENPPLGRPSRMTNLEFARAMHERYRRQWDIMRRSSLANLPGLKIHGMWDDHDFAWNNSYGDNGSNDTHGPAHKRQPVSRDKQAISRRLMRDFFGALHAFGQPYPAQPFDADAIPAAEDLAVPMACASPRSDAVLGCVRLDAGAKLLLTDGRSFRTRPDVPAATVFGERQWQWLANQLATSEVVLFACSTTLDEGGIPLDHYPDYDRLVALAERHGTKLLCLTGDVHKLDWRHHGPRVYEAVASGAARSLFGQSGAFGLVRLDDEHVTVQLRLGAAAPRLTRKIDRAGWHELR